MGFNNVTKAYTVDAFVLDLTSLKMYTTYADLKKHLKFMNLLERGHDPPPRLQRGQWTSTARRDCRMMPCGMDWRVEDAAEVAGCQLYPHPMSLLGLVF